MARRARKVLGNGTGRIGIYSLREYTSNVAESDWIALASQAEWLTPGTYTWVCPSSVTSVSAVCVGAGGAGYSTWNYSAGGGGGLGWKNSIPVTPGQSYTVVVGASGRNNGGGNGWTGGVSYFLSAATVAGYGGTNTSAVGTGGGPNPNSSGGGWVGDGGGAGGSASYQGGGAGGYAGNGGGTNAAAGTNSGAGAGGQSYSSTYGGAAGGGVGIYGLRTDYTAQPGIGFGANAYSGTGQGATSEAASTTSGYGGQGGSKRTGNSGVVTGRAGMQGENGQGQGYYGSNCGGGFPGGGGGGSGTSSGGGNGADGAVRIIWAGDNSGPRSFPSTLTTDL
jgi:hypothetical protein